MKRPEPIRELLPVTPKQGVTVVYKRFSRLPQGGIVCTVSYLESKKPVARQEKKKTLLVRIVSVLSWFRGALGIRLSRFRAAKSLYRALEGGKR